jgi:hypothetical protein
LTAGIQILPNIFGLLDLLLFQVGLAGGCISIGILAEPRCIASARAPSVDAALAVSTRAISAGRFQRCDASDDLPRRAKAQHVFENAG